MCDNDFDYTFSNWRSIHDYILVDEWCGTVVRFELHSMHIEHRIQSAPISRQWNYFGSHNVRAFCRCASFNIFPQNLEENVVEKIGASRMRLQVFTSHCSFERTMPSNRINRVSRTLWCSFCPHRQTQMNFHRHGSASAYKSFANMAALRHSPIIIFRIQFNNWVLYVYANDFVYEFLPVAYSYDISYSFPRFARQQDDDNDECLCVFVCLSQVCWDIAVICNGASHISDWNWIS